MSLASTNSMTFVIEGGVNVSITITEVDGDLRFDLSVLDDTGFIGDLNAVFFDILDESLLGGLTVTGADENGVVFKADSVTKVDNFTNMNGEVIKDSGKFDGGIQFGTQGIGADDIRETSFVLSHDTAALTLDLFAQQDFGVRLTSVGVEGGSRDGSLKLGGTSPEVPDVAADPIANNDVLTTDENAGFGFGDSFDFLDSGASSILANDTDGNGGAYGGSVVSMNGTTIDPTATQDMPIFISGSNGGTLMITADGSINFSATNVDTGDNPFFLLEDGEQASTFFEYSIDGGATAMLEVIVLGSGDDGTGGPIDFF